MKKRGNGAVIGILLYDTGNVILLLYIGSNEESEKAVQYCLFPSLLLFYRQKGRK